jgi:hypothetical protein
MYFQVNHGVGQVGRLSGHSALNDTVSSLMQTAASTDTGLVIMNIPGIQMLMSGGSTSLIHRDAVEEIQVPSPKKKSVHCIHEKIVHQIEPQDAAHVPGCCGDSLSGCHHFTVSMFKFCKNGYNPFPVYSFLSIFLKNAILR